ncbi:MAG TPA: hypothetical protein DCF33_20445, partial [Saprospirales bacterium]|nr:hypothetical protein [Saprospirales bacterium]
MQLPFKTRYPFKYLLLFFSTLGVICFFMPDSGLMGEPAISGMPLWYKIVRYATRVLYHVVFLFFSLNLYYHLIVNRKRLGTYVVVTGKIVLASLSYHVMLYYVLPGFLLKKYDSLPDMLCTCIQGMIPLLVLSFVFAYLTNIREALVQRRILQEQKLQLEMEKSQANFNFLKAQINPHFLHNTLNFLYAKSLPYSEELSEGILTLSDIMRYALDEQTRQDGKALLADEVEHVNNVIKINQLRFENQLQVHFTVQGSLEGLRIAPFVLITLVENAFKHG